MARVSGTTRGVFPVSGTPSRKTVGGCTTQVVLRPAVSGDCQRLRVVDSVLADTAELSLDDSRVLDSALVEVFESDLTDAEAAEVAHHLIGLAMAADFGEVAS